MTPQPHMKRLACEILTMSPDDIPAVIAMQRRVFPGMSPWRTDQLESHLRHFPEGQLVAIDPEGNLLGSASSLIVLWDDYDDMADWRTLTGAGTFDTHNPAGRTLYGADLGVAPEARGQSVGRRLYEARKAIVKRLGLKRMMAGGRLPGYADLADRMSVEAYVEEVMAGRRKDTVLSFQLANGFRLQGIIPDYLTFDQASKGYATLIEWVNPSYAARPPSGH